MENFRKGQEWCKVNAKFRIILKNASDQIYRAGGKIDCGR